MKNKPLALLFSLLLLLGATAAILAPMDADAGRFGGGSSSGSRGSRSFSTPREAAPRTDMNQSMSRQSTPAQQGGGLSRFGSGLMGGIGGFLLGGMLGSLLFGGAGGGFGLLEILLIGAAIWFGLRLLGRRGAPQTQPGPHAQPLPAGSDGSSARINLEKAPYRTEPGSDTASRFQGSDLPRTFSMGGGDAATPDEVSAGLARIMAMDPAFNEEQFLAGARSAFQQIQGAWSDWSVERLRPVLTDRMWEMIQHQARERQNAGRRDIVEKIRFESAAITEAWQEAGEDWLTVRFLVDMVEYETDVAGRILSGDPNRPVRIEEFWTFCRPVGTRNPNWFLSAVQQPGEVAKSVL